MWSRRELLSSLAASGMARARGTGAAVVLDVRSRRLLAVQDGAVAGRFLAPPGSTIKPIVLAALLRSGKLAATESFLCPGRLTIAGRSLNCSHPRLDSPMRVDTAIAYSCNCFVAHVAERFAPGELAAELARAGLSSPTGFLHGGEAAGRVLPAAGRDAIQLQALGEGSISITVVELAAAYRGLALQAAPPIVAGLEGAVEYGTAQRARVPGVKVAGKTGSVLAESRAPLAWFAGFLPSRNPEVAIAVMLQGRSGGSDAAPVAGEILAAYRAGRL